MSCRRSGYHILHSSKHTIYSKLYGKCYILCSTWKNVWKSLTPDGFNTLLLCLDISLWKCSKFLLARRGIFAWKCGKNPRHWAVDRTEVTFKVQWGDLSSPKNTPNHSTLAHSEYCLQMEWSPLWCQEPEHLSRVSFSVTYYLLRIVEKIFHQQDWQNKTDFSVTQDYK